MRKHVLLLIAVFLIAAVPASAQERPKIGVVLGGGGARGAAHIGVLRELEKLRVPIDAIAGTSMGAVVGGLYSSGVSLHELEELMASIDWQDAFQDTSKREDMTYRRKQDDESFPIRFEMGLRDGRPVLPKGLISGQKLGWILRELTLHVPSISRFDELPIPFRAVASDIETGDPYVMTEGDLVLAMRASMSAPGIFLPVRVDGHLLVDGGLTGNVPVNVVRDMGVDIVIAVDVEFPLYTPEQLESALEITGQMLTILIRKETRRQLAGLNESDILIRPDLGDHGSTEFENITDTVGPGAAATRAQSNRLRELSLDEASYAAHRAGRAGKKRPPQRIAFVRIDDDGPLSPEFLESHLETKTGDAIDPDKLAMDAKRLYGLGLYEHVGYRIVTENQQTGVQFETITKSWGPDILQFGLSIEDDFEGATAFNVSARLTRTGLNSYGAEWRTDAQIGTDPFIFSEFYQPLGAGSRFFLAPRISLQQSNFNAFTNDVALARYRLSEAQLGFDLGHQFGRRGELRIGLQRGVGEARVKVGDPTRPNFDFDTGGIFARFGFDSLDDAQIPLHGTRVDVEWQASRPGFGADGNFDTIETELTSVRTFGRHSVLFGLHYATTLDSDDTIQEFFPLGGFLRLSGLERGEISGPHAGVVRLVYYRRSGETGGLLDMPLYFGGSIEAGNVWQTRSDIGTGSLIVNGSLFAGLDTVLGPMFLAAGVGEKGDSSFYLFFGSPPR
ncbi:MAG: patatin-like phospholipase family protein [Woeseia sp.]